MCNILIFIYLLNGISECDFCNDSSNGVRCIVDYNLCVNALD